MSKYLLEIGVEELPYSLIEPISEQIKSNLEKSLEENNVNYTNIKTYTTPRRLVFIIDGLSEVGQDSEKIYRGPNTKVAFNDNGEYTQAAIGFTRKFGADLSDLYKIAEGDQEYVALKIIDKGKSVAQVMPQIVPDCVLKVQGPHFMRWSAFDEKFSRPIRWIVSILDNKEIPLEITGIKSSKKSRAHRFCNDKYPEITDVDTYFDIMLKHNVIVDAEARKAQIVKSVNDLAASIGAEVKIEEELLKEVSNIVEWPKPVLGNFDEKYLQIPEPVIVTVMASHQRYFPIYKNGKLLNGFITVANYVGDDFSNIKNGNERVIKARLDDAIFFYNEDIKKPLIDRVDDLEGMTFQKGLGSLKEKVGRIIKISDEIAKHLGYKKDDETYNNILRTALFCKADLTTSLVFEFTELQGVIGSYYAKIFNENDAIAKGIKEHYYPLVSDAQLATGIEGQVVGIADKLDTICAVFALNKIPTGSADPLGIRRAAVGILQTIMNKKLPLNLLDLISFTISRFEIEIKDVEELKKNIAIFFVQRLRGIFANKFETSYIDAVLSTRSTLQSLAGVVDRLNLLHSVSNTEDFDKVIAAHTRINKIVNSDSAKTITHSDNSIVQNIYKSKDIMNSNNSSIDQINKIAQRDVLNQNKSSIVDTSLFQCDAEDSLYRFVLGLSAKKGIAAKLFYDNLVAFVPVIDKFFEDVMVMDENIQIRSNRIKLLIEANKEFFKIADFTKIVK